MGHGFSRVERIETDLKHDSFESLVDFRYQILVEKYNQGVSRAVGTQFDLYCVPTARQLAIMIFSTNI